MSYILPESYEGWLEPKVGYSKYKIIDDPEIIAQKNELRRAMKEEFTKQIYNPYRQACGVGGYPFDPAVQRYLSAHKYSMYYFRPGPRTSFFGFLLLVFIPYLTIQYNERVLAKRTHLRLTGQVAYKDLKAYNFQG